MDSQPWGEGGFGVISPTPPAPPPTRPRPRVGPRVVTGIAVAAIIALFLVIQPWDGQRRQTYADQMTVWLNPPTAEIVELAEATAMSEDGRRIFFATQPQLADADLFNSHCSMEGSTVLGCYDGERIYIYRVTDTRLAGTNEVTAAHELLHAAYQRLSASDRRDIDALVSGFVATLDSDDPVRQLVEGYPVAQQPDEWHSRLATEFSGLAPELEAHYSRYFADRGALLQLNDQSNAPFRDLQEQITALTAELDTLGPAIDAASAAYESGLAAYTADVADFNARADSGDFTSQEQFDNERAELVAHQEALESERTTLNDQVDHYNALLHDLNDLDASYAELYAQLDSTAAPGAP